MWVSKSLAKPAFWIPGLAAILLLVGLLAYRIFFAENPHYFQALRYIETHSFAEAESELRLCLDDNSSHQRAKGLLAYTVMRREFEEFGDEEEAKSALLNSFYQFYTLYRLRSKVSSIRDEDTRKRLEELIRETEKYVRERFKRERIPFRDWDDVIECIYTAGETLYRLRARNAETLDTAVKDVAASLTAYRNPHARDYLLSRMALDPDLIGLALVVGPEFRKSLESEASRKSTFIEKESRAALRMLDLKDELKRFANDHENIRCMKKSDLPSDQRLIMEDEDVLTFLSSDWENLLVRLEAVEELKTDPCSINVTYAKIDDEKMIYVVSAFDARAKEWVARPLFWNGSEFQQLSIEALDGTMRKELREKLPIGLEVQFASDVTEFCLAIRKAEDVKRTREESGTRTVVRYQVQEYWNPNKYGRGYGGYEEYRVPYQTTEPYTRTVSYKERAVGNKWRIYRFSEANGTLKMTDQLWVEDGESLELAISRNAPIRQPRTSSESVSLPPERSVSGEKFPETRMRILSYNEYSDWNDYDIQYALTELVARRGYDIVKPHVKRIFQNALGENYKIVPGRTLSQAESYFTRIERGNYENIAAERERRKRIGTYVAPW